MGWLPVVTISEPVFPTLVRAFYSRVTYELGGPVLSIVRGVEIRLSPERISRILDIPSVGLCVYEAKAWPTVPGFEPREAVQRLCGLADPQGMGKPSAHSLIVTSRVLHHMICSILLPRGGHRDEVSYLEAFIVDSILTGRRIHVGYLMMMHMISCVNIYVNDINKPKRIEDKFKRSPHLKLNSTRLATTRSCQDHTKLHKQEISIYLRKLSTRVHVYSFN